MNTFSTLPETLTGENEAGDAIEIVLGMRENLEQEIDVAEIHSLQHQGAHRVSVVSAYVQVRCASVDHPSTGLFLAMDTQSGCWWFEGEYVNTSGESVFFISEMVTLRCACKIA